MFNYGNANEAQKEAISATDGLVLITAGPGTGKTFTLVKRAVYLIQECGIKPEQIMMATFTEKAAKELITRITNELAERNVSVNVNEMYIGTFHSLCLRIIKENLEFTRLKRNYRLLDTFDQKYLVFRNFHKFKNIEGIDELLSKGGSWKRSDEICTYINHLSEEMVDIEALQSDDNPGIRTLGRVLSVYQEMLEEGNLIDFSTIQTECYKLLMQNKQILEELQDKLQYLMIDEYQDTNYIREQIGLSEKETNIDSMKEQERFSEFSLTAEISRYMNISCLTIAKILRESVDGSGNIVAAVNRHNEILEDVIIPEIFHTLYEVKSTQKSEDVDMVLLREPKDSGYYEFSANDELVITKGHNNFTPKEEAKSFHADTYCFDSKPEKECFLQYISSNKVKEIYFTGMFTSNQGDLSVQYYDPESKRLRKYYPDFLALMEDGSYQLIEVKGDNKIDDEVVLAKKAAAEEMAVASGVHYLMYAGSTLMKSNVLEPTLAVQQTSIDI